MKIGLLNEDGKFFNLALARLSAYWNAQPGCTAEEYDPFEHYDRVYCSKIFTFTPSYQYFINADEVVKGGTGYRMYDTLPEDIENTPPDLYLFGILNKNQSVGFLTRGCPNKCGFCVVPLKEGKIKPYNTIEQVAQGRKQVTLFDNNILAAGDYAHEQLARIANMGVYVDFNQGLDARLMTEQFADELIKCKWKSMKGDKIIRFACDHESQIPFCDNAIKMLRDRGYKGLILIYTIIDNDFYGSFKRTQHFKDKKDNMINVQSQPYLDPNKTIHSIPQWQKDMAHWTNKKQLFHSCEFRDFEPRIGFKCYKYFEN